ncbi:S1C family serine protease [Actinokineospora inagensis]|uniref:S1C family serine protease n=1 Tax=Actinokineospora inagensis TaxID=103730 RepID=UPI000418CD7A|nr:trypsin-like peptidase domain-containing protein [Actinokineospora inagensis]
MTENGPDDQAGHISPWSARGANAAAGQSGDRTPDGEQGPVRPEAGTPAREEQGLAASGAGASDQTPNQTWTGQPSGFATSRHTGDQPTVHGAGSTQPETAHGSVTGPTPHGAASQPEVGHSGQYSGEQAHHGAGQAGAPEQQALYGLGPSHQAGDTGQHATFGGAAGQPRYDTGGVSGTAYYGAAGTQQFPPQQRREPRRTGFVVGVTVLALLVGGGAGVAGGLLSANHDKTGGSSSTALDAQPPAKQTGSATAGSVESVAQKVLPTVVQLQVRGRSAAGEGSGFVISADGLIVTNNHVVEVAADGGQIQAVFQDGKTATATVVGRDPTSDVAVVKAQGVSGLQVSELGRSDDLRVGQAVVAVGSPFELSGTVTSGIVSSLHRPTRAGGDSGSQTTVMDAIQTDAAINPGNSGGPLVNMQGQVIGINSAIYSPQSGEASAGSVGIGFAIPIDQARRTADEIVKTGKATQTVLGVSVRDNDNGGALIADIVAGGAGEKAGLKQGDVVTKLNDRRIDTSDALVAAVRALAPGDKVTLTLQDNRTVQATLGGQPVTTN